MQRFVIFTRGRTGSSAIVEELDSHPDVVCHQEAAEPEPVKKYGITPLRLFAEPVDADRSKGQFAEWLAYMAQAAGLASAVGFKLLENHLAHILDGERALGDWQVIFLQRRNRLRQAVSGMVASKVGLHNTRNPVAGGRRLTLDPRGVVTRLRQNAATTVERRKQFNLHAEGMLEVFYEDWVADRVAFYEPIFAVLKVTPMELPRSSFQVTTPEPLPELLQNWDEIAAAVRKAGFEEYLALER